MAECSICCDVFNKSTRKPVKCGACDIVTCKACTVRYLMDTIKDAHCMGCKHPWDREKLVEAMSLTFVNTTYKSYRERVLLDREKAMLPETMPYVEHEKKIRKINQEIHEHKTERRKLRLKFIEFRGTLSPDMEEMEDRMRLQADMEIQAYAHDTQWKMLARLKRAIDNSMIKVHTTKQFVRGCPNADCRGFVNHKWICGLCEAVVCKDCHEVVVPQAPDCTDQHECNPDNVATAKLIMKDSKPCPKCSTMIFKINGCDQMFCVQCHTAFSWRSGEVETGTIHNPHYYEMLRRSGVGVPRAPGDEICGGMPHYLDLMAYARASNLGNRLTTHMLNMVRLHGHIQRVELATYRVDAVADNRDLRVKFLLQDIDEVAFKRTIQQRDKRNQRNREVTAVLQLVNSVIVDILTRYIQEGQKEVLDEMTPLVEIANKELGRISNRYGNKTPHIMENDLIVA